MGFQLPVAGRGIQFMILGLLQYCCGLTRYGPWYWLLNSWGW